MTTMPARTLRLFCLLSCVLLAAPALAQEGHPARGTWAGYWGPSASENRLVIVMDYDGKNLSGTVNPGANAVPIKLARLDITPGKPPAKPGEPVGEPAFSVHIEVDAKDAKGNPVVIVADGTMQQVALPSRSIVGTWTQTSGGKTVKGEFRISRQ
jgi:hypothetical protein